MGQSPSADLYWGYDLGDMTDRESWDSLKPSWMDDAEGGEDRDWEEELATRLGWAEAPFPDGAPDHSRWYRALGYKEAEQKIREAEEIFQNTPEYKAWSASLAEMRRLVENYPIELETYGYIDEPQYCVRIRSSVQRAYDWGSIELKPLYTRLEWHQQLMDFMALMKLPMPDSDPCWHMNCSYG